MLELIFVDGYGVVYLWGLGIVVYLGVVIDLFIIGVVKKILVGSYDVVGLKCGDCILLMYCGCMIGIVLCSKDGI